MAGGKKRAKHAAKRDKAKKSRRFTTSSATLPPPKSGTSVPAIASDDGRNVGDTLAPPEARGRLSEMVPVRFDPETLAAIKRRAADDRRSVSSWIRRAVDMELDRSTTA